SAAPSAASGAGAAAASPSASAAPTKVKLGWVSVSAANSAIWSAEDGGYLKKYGLDAENPNFADSTQAVAALISKGTNINCGISGTAIVAANLKGSDLVIIASTISTFPNSLYSKTSLAKVADLKGKKVGVTRIGTASDTAARLALKSGGLDPDKDVEYIQTGGLNETVAALQANQIDAGALSPPQTLAARKLGFKELIDVSTLGLQYVYNGVAVSKAWAGQNSATVEAVLKAILEGEHRFKTDAAFGKQVVATRAKLKDQGQIDETYSLFATKYLTYPPVPTEAAIVTVLDELSKTRTDTKGADPKKFLDTSYIQKLQDSGFIKGLGS
ncbi:MAG: ABC transporter substrate-binding protein, partial [Chloroflexota bacterium]|nr:ABC transporter substrate-binding protein [Chloroflexota bacterium]